MKSRTLQIINNGAMLTAIHINTQVLQNGHYDILYVKGDHSYFINCLTIKPGPLSCIQNVQINSDQHLWSIFTELYEGEGHSHPDINVTLNRSSSDCDIIQLNFKMGDLLV